MSAAPDDPTFLQRLAMLSGGIDKKLQPYGGSTNLALTLLQNSGYSTTPRTFGQVLGTSALQAQQSASQRADDNLRRQYMEAQLAQFQRQQQLEANRGQDWTRTQRPSVPVQTPADGIGPVPPPDYKPPSFGDRMNTAVQSALERGDIVGAAQNAQIGASLAKEPNLTDDLKEYRIAQLQGYKGSFFDYQRDLRQAGASPAANVTLNTDKSLYGTLAEQQAKQYSELYASAQATPETVARAERIRDVLGQGAFTGTGATFKLEAGKALRSAGFDFGGTDVENTEALAAEMARSTLDSIKSSGLAGSQGLTEGERKFLERAVSGQISLEPGTIRRLADLNERVARSTLKRWNDTSSRLDATQLRQLGMTSIGQPAPTRGGSLTGTLTRNPDGSYNYSPGP
jgi:hypothetical protein